MSIYTTKTAAPILGQHWITISRHCRALQDNKHIILFAGRYQIDEIGLRMIKKNLLSIGWQPGKKRAKAKSK